MPAHRGEKFWATQGGTVLEPALTPDSKWGDAPVRLLDARWLIALAMAEGSKLPRRQDLPERAFISLEALSRDFNWGYGQSLPVVVVSHAWLQPDHPDPRGENLRLLGALLCRWAAASGLDEKAKHAEGKSLGVFIDFACIHQKDGTGKRTEKEQALFSSALRSMSLWYSHPNTPVFKLTKLPAGYPAGFDFPAGATANTAAYGERGWCFFESMLAGASKRAAVLDVGKWRPTRHKASIQEIVKQCATGRAAPLPPGEFRAALETKSFSSRNADLEVVSSLYASCVTAELRRAKQLTFTELRWGSRGPSPRCPRPTSCGCCSTRTASRTPGARRSCTPSTRARSRGWSTCR